MPIVVRMQLDATLSVDGVLDRQLVNAGEVSHACV